LWPLIRSRCLAHVGVHAIGPCDPRRRFRAHYEKLAVLLSEVDRPGCGSAAALRQKSGKFNGLGKRIFVVRVTFPRRRQD